MLRFGFQGIVPSQAASFCWAANRFLAGNEKKLTSGIFFFPEKLFTVQTFSIRQHLAFNLPLLGADGISNSKRSADQTLSHTSWCYRSRSDRKTFHKNVGNIQNKFTRFMTHLKGWSAVDIRRAQFRDSLVACASGRILIRLWVAAKASTALFNHR